MSRLIDADALLKKHSRKADIWTALTNEDTAADFAFYCKLADAVGEMPTVGGWISVKDRLPETNDEVLTTYVYADKSGKRYVEAASYWDDGEGEGHWCSVWDEYRVGNARKTVIAWMPMPRPYKPEVDSDGEKEET